MIKVTFELDQEDPDHKDALTTFTNWGDFYYPVWELKHNMHSKFKHKQWNDDQWKAYEEIRDWLNEEFERAMNHVD